MSTRTAFHFVAILPGVLLASCSLPQRLPAVPDELEVQAEVVGMPGVRFTTDVIAFQREMEDSKRPELEARAKAGHVGPLPPAHYLALSGGGDNGAGLLNGWTAADNRPEFMLVTGISTGALISPFAFLGSNYDAQLKTVFTTISAKDIFTKRNLTAAVLNDAMADNSPLMQLLRKYVTAEMLREIAVERGKGRFLMIGTTNLDAMKGVVWDMGKIAASGHPGALDLFHRIMIASAAIPGAFPPVLVDVEAAGGRYQEMHVDGGTTAQLFVYPTAFRLKELAAAAGIERERHLYIIRNARIDPDWTDVERRVLSISGRSISSLIQMQGRGDLYRTFLVAQRDGVDFNLAYIPSTFNVPHPEEFDTAFMGQLFQFGYDAALNGYPWDKTAPDY